MYQHHDSDIGQHVHQLQISHGKSTDPSDPYWFLRAACYLTSRASWKGHLKVIGIQKKTTMELKSCQT